MEIQMSTIMAPAFLELMLEAAHEVQKDTSQRVPLEGFPEFIAFFSEEKPKSFFYDLTSHLDQEKGGIYIDHAPKSGKNPMLRFAVQPLQA